MAERPDKHSPRFFAFLRRGVLVVLLCIGLMLVGLGLFGGDRTLTLGAVRVSELSDQRRSSIGDLYRLRSTRGMFHFAHGRFVRNPIAYVEPAGAQSEQHHFVGAWRFWRAHAARAQPNMSVQKREYFWPPVRISGLPPPPATLRPQGFSGSAYEMPLRRGQPDLSAPLVSVPPATGWSIRVPVWLPAALALAWPGFRLLQARWRVARRLGTCHHCGYDLRASSHRCPECGAATVTERIET